MHSFFLLENCQPDFSGVGARLPPPPNRLSAWLFGGGSKVSQTLACWGFNLAGVTLVTLDVFPGAREFLFTSWRVCSDLSPPLPVIVKGFLLLQVNFQGVLAPSASYFPDFFREKVFFSPRAGCSLACKIYSLIPSPSVLVVNRKGPGVECRSRIIWRGDLGSSRQNLSLQRPMVVVEVMGIWGLVCTPTTTLTQLFLQPRSWCAEWKGSDNY